MFDVEFNDTTRAYFQKFGAIEGGNSGADTISAANTRDRAAIARLKLDPTTNGILHTTCVATQIAGGHAPNALPHHATANVNCRIFPGYDPAQIRDELIRAIGDAGVSVEFQSTPEKPGAPPPLSKEVMSQAVKPAPAHGTASIWLRYSTS